MGEQTGTAAGRRTSRKEVTAKNALLAAQRQWASSHGLLLDARGYASGYEANLFRPLSSQTLVCFQNGSGNELRDSARRPAKMCAAHSSSALTANVFDYWVDTPGVALQLLELPGQALSVQFEAQFHTRLPGEPPNLDLCIERAGDARVAVESKFTEWLTPHPAGAPPFKDKYFADGQRVWEAAGLPACQRLARQMQDGQVAFRFLNAAQLLKHALGLAVAGAPFELVYLYFDAAGPESQQHAAETEAFARHIAGDFAFHVRTYQRVFDRVRKLAGPADANYVAYLQQRYFS